MKKKTSYSQLESRTSEQEENQNQERNYKAIFENSPEVIVFVDPGGIVQDVNQRVMDWLGYPPEELKGKHFSKLAFMDEETRRSIGEKFRKRQEGDAIPPYTLELFPRNGKKQIGRVVASTLIDEKGVPSGSLMMISDVTAQYEQTQMVKKASERNLALFRAVPDMIFITDRKGDFVDFKAERDAELVVPREQIIGKSIDSMGFQEETLALMKQNLEQAFLTGDLQTFEYELAAGPGKGIYECRSVPLNENEVISVIRTITHRKQTEKELNLKNLAFESSLAGNSISDTAGIITHVNRMFLELWGYQKAEELIGQPISILVNNPADSDNALKALREKGVWKGEFVARKKDGSTFISQGYATSVTDDTGRVIGYHTANLDITDKRDFEASLRESERKYRALLEDNIDAVFLFDLNGIHLEVNQKVLDMFGYTREEVIGEHLSKLVSSDELDDSQSRINRLQAGETLPVYERTFVKKDGTEFSGEINVSLIRDRDGKPTHFQSIVRDISQRKQAALDVEKRQNYLESFLNAIPEGVVALDSSHRILEWNPGAEKLFGFSKEEVTGKNIDDLITNPDTKEEANRFTTRVLSGEQVYPQETVRYRKDGSRVHVLLSGSPIHVQGKLQGVVAIYMDISSQKKIEEELKKADKLESLALLAGGIAHDFNNILGSISVNVGLFKLSKEDPAKMRARMNEIEFALSGARNLTRQLLTFSKGNAPVKQPVELPGLIRETVTFSLSGSNVKCQLDLPEDLWQAEIDGGQIGQVIQNITINADQAMPEGGNLSVKAENVEGDALKGLPLNGEKYVKIEFRDHGIGIPQQHLNNIFDPFFTTKQKGGGLGLSTAFSIIKNHEGIIRVESEIGKFTCFIVYLPALAEKAALKKEDDQSVVTGTGRILLMDDDKMILGATGELLKHLGYQVVSVEKGEEALSVYKEALESGNRFSAVILDLTIPDGLGGKETIRELLKMDPRAIAIASSGYSVDPIISEYRSFGFSGAIAKPYSIQALSRVLNKVISPAGG